MCIRDRDKNVTVVFAQNKNIPADFVFDDDGILVEAPHANLRKYNKRIFIENVSTGTNAAIRIKQPDQTTITIILLDEIQSLTFWQGNLAGKDRFFLSTSGLTFQQDELQLEDERRNKISVAIYPAPTNLTLNKQTLKGKADGMFTRFDISIQSQKPIRAKLVPLQKEILPLRDIKLGKAKVAEMPTNNDFKNAAQWKIVLSENLDTQRDIYLRIPYIGDVARIYKGNELLTDNFYNCLLYTSPSPRD